MIWLHSKISLKMSFKVYTGSAIACLQLDKDNKKSRILNEIQTVFDLRVTYKKQGAAHQEVFKLITNSVYGRIIMKDIRFTEEYVSNELL